MLIFDTQKYIMFLDKKQQQFSKKYSPPKLRIVRRIIRNPLKSTGAYFKCT